MTGWAASCFAASDRSEVGSVKMTYGEPHWSVAVRAANVAIRLCQAESCPVNEVPHHGVRQTR